MNKTSFIDVNATRDDIRTPIELEDKLKKNKTNKNVFDKS